MNYKFNQTFEKRYTSASQKARVLTEKWAEENLFCPRCGNPFLKHFPNNRAVADFFCPNCFSEYELKSKRGEIGKKIADGAYDTFIERITSNNNPDFLILSYDPEELCVNNLWIIPKWFFVPSLVEKRKPLSASAKRAGWTGCNILFDQIPEQGRIFIIKNREEIEKDIVMDHISKAAMLRTNNINARGWLMDILNCINQIPFSEFSLDEVYKFEDILIEKYPDNYNIRPKIRQQLQVLRDKGYIEFVDRGKYRKL